MIELVASLLFAVFPVRGSVWRSLDSALVLDRDTVHLQAACLVGYCYSCQYGVVGSGDTSRIAGFPDGGRASPRIVDVTWNSTPIMDIPPGTTTCTPKVSLFAEKERRFVVHGTRNWAVWADFVRDTIRNGVVLKPVQVRWRWAPIEPSVPWVRWMDTLHIGPQPYPSTKYFSFSDQPVLTTIKPVTLDSIVPSVLDCARGLRLHSESAAGEIFDWSYSQTACRLDPQGYDILNPTATIPSATVSAGLTFLAMDAFNSLPDALWRMRVGGRKVDSLWMIGAAPTMIPVPARVPSPRSETLAYEPATGRRIRLSSPMPTGKHLLAGPAGTRLILVE